MHQVNIMSSPARDQVKNDWEFAEVWIDPTLAPPYMLLLLSDRDGNCQVCDPVQKYTTVFASSTYQEAEFWLLEDEYEPVEGRILASALD